MSWRLLRGDEHPRGRRAGAALLCGHCTELTVTDLVARIGLPESNASRLSRAMRDAGLLETVWQRKRYRRGLRQLRPGRRIGLGQEHAGALRPASRPADQRADPVRGRGPRAADAGGTAPASRAHPGDLAGPLCLAEPAHVRARHRHRADADPPPHVRPRCPRAQRARGGAAVADCARPAAPAPLPARAQRRPIPRCCCWTSRPARSLSPRSRRC
jgi:hypothetical protein